jgi:hypothetical protein
MESVALYLLSFLTSTPDVGERLVSRLWERDRMMTKGRKTIQFSNMHRNICESGLCRMLRKVWKTIFHKSVTLQTLMDIVNISR